MHVRVSISKSQNCWRTWVLTPKEPDFKARLVVQGCQEDPSMVRTDSPTGSRDSVFLFLSFTAQEHWSCGSADAASAYLQARRGTERLPLLMMPKRQPPPGCEPGEVRVARGSTYGTRDSRRSWYQHLRDRLADCFTHLTRVANPPSHCWKPIVKEFNMSRKQDDFVFCGRRVLCYTGSFARQLRICGLISCSDGIVWTPAICRNHVDIQRTQNISVCWENSNGCNFNHVQICHTK